MPHHEWGDSWFKEHGQDLFKAEVFISTYVYKWSRCNFIMKEKYGTLRYEFIFPPGGGIRTMYKIPNPFHKPLGEYEGFQDWVNKTTKFQRKSWLWNWCDSFMYKLWVRYGKFIVRRAIKKACKKWPNVEREILADCWWLRNG